MIGAGGLVVSVIAFGVGAILDWAVTEPYQHGFNINKVGWILMLVGAIGAMLSIIVMVVGNMRRRRTVVDDGRGNVVRRVDSTVLGRRFRFSAFAPGNRGFSESIRKVVFSYGAAPCVAARPDSVRCRVRGPSAVDRRCVFPSIWVVGFALGRGENAGSHRFYRW